MLRCPICNTEDIEKSTDHCPTCEWNLAPHPLAIRISSAFLDREQERLEWAKNIWTQLKVQSSSNLNSDTYHEQLSEIRQLDHSNDKQFQLPTTLEQPKQNTEHFLLASKQREEDLNKYLVDESVAEQFKQEEVKLQFRLHEAKKQIEYLTHLEGIAKVVLSQWLWTDLLNQFIFELEGINDCEEALSRIKQLQQRRYEQEWKSFPVHCLLLQFVIDFLEEKQEYQEENLRPKLESYHTVIVVDAVLAVQAELRFHSVIKCDAERNYLYGL